MTNAPEKLSLAKDHLDRVLAAWDEPTDWKDLSVYGFSCLEAAVDAVSMHMGSVTKRDHTKREHAAKEFHDRFGLPDVSGLLIELNEARKSELYGDVPAPDLDAEDVASDIEAYVNEVERLLTTGP